ncbi:hypothetical protein [Neopusillimonas aromaticivorans]|uniref:hypothetical protein n=1 Tax=Neopusillimonas aromaticivorans TaxID=2979868 RepID=UPI0025936131|nr:hypothetical protein [Neopusillimonas aromaticivorans]WJJ93177.1 hypothetical protein N7E01_14170 [Neopusillimonas aromaticivorans]
MNISRFFGATNREALRQVRLALGPDALIISNRRVNGGVEILATDQTSLPDGLAEQIAAQEAAAAASQPPVTMRNAYRRPDMPPAASAPQYPGQPGCPSTRVPACRNARPRRHPVMHSAPGLVCPGLAICSVLVRRLPSLPCRRKACLNVPWARRLIRVCRLQV